MNSKARSRIGVKVDEGVIGVDIGKYQHVAVAQSWNGSRLKPLVFENNRKGFERLLNYQAEAKESLKVTNMRVALEPTGHYWESLTEWIDTQGIRFEMVQPAHTHKAKELEDNSPGKTDCKDAGIIADLVIQGKGLRLVRRRGVYAELRYLAKFRQELVRDINREVNRLHRVMDVLFPELLGLFKKHIGKGLKALLSQAAVPAKILELGVNGLSKLLRQGSRGCLGLKRARAILEAARDSVGVKNGLKALEMELKQLLDRLEISQKQIKEIEKQMVITLEKVPYVDILSSIPQIGKITIAAVLGETGDLRQYQHVRQIIKLARLNLYEISSGQHRGRKRIAKRGRSLLRQILYLAGLRLIRQKGIFYRCYQRLVGRGKAKVQAIIAVSCKLLRVLFALVRDNRMYKERIEENITGRFPVEELTLAGV